jgi:tetratricopeptide (TPR) repeat protein
MAAADDLDAARLAFQRAPHDYVAAFTLGATALAAGDLKTASDALAVAAQHVDDHKGAAASLWSLALAQSGDTAGAARTAVIAANKQTGDARAQQHAVVCLRRVGDDVGALPFAERLAALQNDAASWADVGAAYARAQKHADALRAFGKAEARDKTFFQTAMYESQLRASSTAALESR